MMKIAKVLSISVLLVFLVSAFPAYSQPQLNINQATLEQLVEVKGIGEKTAQKILEYRKEHGAFKSVGELINVNGIGEKKLEALRLILTTKTK